MKNKSDPVDLFRNKNGWVCQKRILAKSEN